MKQFDLTIVTANNKLVYTVEQPQTDEEADKGLAGRKYLPEKHGMIYVYSESASTGMWTPETEIPVDFIFIDEYGDIVKIVHNAEPLSRTMHECDYCKAVLEINGGECAKFGIQVEDSVLHPSVLLSSENAYHDHGFMFKKLNSRTIDSINMEDIAFLSYAEGGAMGWSNSILMFLKNKNGIEKYAISKSYLIEQNNKKFYELFEPLRDYGAPFSRHNQIIMDKSKWDYYSLGMGNHLYVKKEYSNQLSNEITKQEIKRRPELYQNWSRIAYNILTDNYNKTPIENREYWIKQEYYGIDTRNINKVLDAKWWETLEIDEFFLMLKDGDYTKLRISNGNETVLDLGIKHCKNVAILENLKYKKEKMK